MTRSKWKGPYVNPTLLLKINKNKQTNEIKTMSRNSEILPNFVSKTFALHNGNSYNSFIILEEMVGHKFGEFSFTRKRYFFKKNIKKK